MVSAVLLVDASPDTILQFHDQLSNELPTLKGKWNFSFKVFRSNPYSFTNGKADSKFLHTLTLSYLPETSLTLVNKNSSGIFTNVIEDDAPKNAQYSSDSGSRLSFPESHLHKGPTSGFNDPFDNIVNSKLQALWLQRQNIKGDGGQVYELESGNLIIRTSNVFLHGIFKGLLIQIELKVGNGDEVDSSSIESVIEKYSIPKGRLCKLVLDKNNFDEFGDLTLQYAEILNF